MVAVYPRPLNHTMKMNSLTPSVTIVDPRHPLYGGTFRLLKINVGRSTRRICVVEVDRGIIRHVPIEAKNRAATPPRMHEVPIDMASLARLCNLYFSLFPKG